MAAMIEARHVTRRFGHVSALADASLDVAALELARRSWQRAEVIGRL